jgi:prepilin peptidase dependent protein B
VASVGQALYIAGGGDCLLVSWDSNSDGVWNSAPSSESDTTGFRLRDGALETLRGASACSGKGWEKMTNPAAIQVTAFQVTRLERAGRAGIIDYAGGALGRRPANPRAGGIRRDGV